jgi:glycosyltransferase involved in cell wall biosynthesis
MAYGRPVVATRVGGLVDAVEDGVTGVLVPAGDARALRAAIASLLESSKARGELGAAARSIDVSRRSRGVAVEEFCGVLRACADRDERPNAASSHPSA